ncbi:nucleoside transporter NupC [Desulfuromonas versatilis]|uniref:Nucleoside transporter NupC n=1 Tax=Desulfuromonas versatilis TaxID=2802975 RepID=A0ABN6E475_9BACT|nr:nucleoside transporter C-terminal domain-containing protein [Desulfuromonas versatilis]BCR07037.1 nucleoside transporter NupC [Desulfuromonas versatilis]
MEQIIRGGLGIAALVALAVLFSGNRRAIRWKPVGYGLLLNVLFAFLVLRTAPGRAFFEQIGGGLAKIIIYASEGTRFVFGPLYTGFTQVENFSGWPYAFVLDALIPIVFFAALIKVLYYYRIMQRIVGGMAGLFTRLFGISSVEAVVTASNVFLGQTQAPLTVAPYIRSMSESQLFLTMTGGMATVGSGLLIAYAGMGARIEYVLAASIMAAPAAIVFAKLLEPETDLRGDQETAPIDEEHGVNVLDAVARGAMEGWKAVVGVTVMLLAFISLIHLLDGVIAAGSGERANLEGILQVVFAPAAWIVGVPAADVGAFARLVGAKTAFNEVIGFSALPAETLSPKGLMLACFAMTGFANFSSIAIQIGTLGEFAPERRSEVARLGLRALFAATLANLLNAAIAGMFFSG